MIKLCILIHDRDIDVFYYLVLEGSYGNELKNEDLQTLNINYSYKALKIAKKMNVKKFIFAGTINELELMELFNAERNTLRHALIYGISKLASDFYLKTIANREGISYNTAIIGSCFGPGDMSMRIHNTFDGGLFINYSMVDINSIYEDTNYRNDKNVDFKTQIINTANWLKYDRKLC